MVIKAVRTQNKELPSDSLTSMEELYVNRLFSYNLTQNLLNYIVVLRSKTFSGNHQTEVNIVFIAGVVI